MVEIQCPHCEKEVELEDGISGLFDCPYCEEEFEWNLESEEIFEDKTNLEATQPGFLVNIPGATFRAVLGGSVIFTGGLTVLLSLAGISASLGFIDLMSGDSGGSSAGPAGAGAGFALLILLAGGVLGAILSVILGAMGVGAVFTGLGIMARKFPALVIGAMWNFLGLIVTYLGTINGFGLFALPGLVFLASFIAHLLVMFAPSFRFLWFEAA
jgi:hypothetical protein